MNLEIANAISGYIETLYDTNKKLISICGIDVCYHNTGDYEKVVLDIIQNIPRLIPYSFSVKKDLLFFKDTDGLLEYSNEIVYLRENYDKILANHAETLKKVKQIRNKYEHKLHDIQYQSSGSGTHNLFDIEFKVENHNVTIYAGELIKLLKDINILFAKIVQDISTYAYQNNKTDYLYYQRITRFDFIDFNEIYESNLLRKIGKIMNKY